MESSSRLQQWWDTFAQFLNDQPWFQQLKQKWEELDPQSQLYLKFAGAISTALLVIFISFSFVWSVHKKKVELAEKSELLQTIQSANDELRQLRESTASIGAISTGTSEPWPAYLTNLAGTSGIGKESFTVSEEKKGSTSDLAKESLFDLTLKHINIRQAVRYAFALENGVRQVKLRNLSIDNTSDRRGYLDVVLSISAFNFQPAATGK